MKHLLLTLLLVSLTSATALADSPEAILKDYRKQAAQAVERLNQSLEKTATPMITKLVSSGDTAGAEQLTAQLKAKLAGEPVPEPHASAAQLFTLYDEARAKALAPIQKSSVSRIETMLKTSSGSKLETVTELGKVREEIEAGKLRKKVASGPVPQFWTYHMQPTDKNSGGEIELNPNGNFVINNSPPGKWTQSKVDDVITVTLADKATWTITLNGDGTAFLDRPDVGRRFLKVRK